MICCADVVCGIGRRRGGSGRVGRMGGSDPFSALLDRTVEYSTCGECMHFTALWS